MLLNFFPPSLYLIHLFVCIWWRTLLECSYFSFRHPRRLASRASQFFFSSRYSRITLTFLLVLRRCHRARSSAKLFSASYFFSYSDNPFVFLLYLTYYLLSFSPLFPLRNYVLLKSLSKHTDTYIFFNLSSL